MACENPIDAQRPAQGGPLHFGTHAPADGRAYIKIQLPCGYCILCREEQARQAAVRITHEAQLHEHNAFITLTYNNEWLPEHNSLEYRHLALFWKRARKAFGKMRYYAVGEYGEESLRPHYHACVFGQGFTKNRIWIRQGTNPLWTTAELEKCWGMGNVSVGDLNFQTARYTASYVTKKLRAKQQYVRTDEETGELIPLQQPRAFMSRNLARAWWPRWGQQVEELDRVVINAQPQKPPRAYDKWIGTTADFTVSRHGVAWRSGEVGKRKLERIKQKRVERIETSTSEQKRAHARNAHARARQKSKSV